MALDIGVILPYTVSRTYQPMEIDMAHCITYISADGKNKVEVHMLNVGDGMAPFGGSSSGLLVRKTASLVTRHKAPWGTRDVEWDIHSPRAWNWIAELTSKHGFTAVPAVVVEEDA
jgi:hypothetical protein